MLHGLTVFGLLYAAYVFLVQAPRTGTFGYDAFAYWSVSLAQPYTIPHGALGSFPYAPPIALLFDLFGAVPWSNFVLAWACFGIAP